MKYDPTHLDQFKSRLALLPENLTEIGIRDIFVGPGLRREVSKFIPHGSKVVLVMGNTPMFVNDENIKETIEEKLRGDFEDVVKIELKHEDCSGGMIHADFENVEKVKKQLFADAVVVSIGSGTITDITKHACYLFEKENECKPLRFIVVQTANTVTAFTSNIAVLLKDGVKRTYSSRYPDYVISDLEILRDAPYELTQAGFGDLIARYVSYPDWYLGWKVGNLGIYNEVPKDLLDESLEWLLENAEKVAEREPEAIKILTKALLNAGLSMSIIGMSTPISGYEHVISHVLDMKAGVDRRESDLHGIQVGIASVLSAYVYEELLALDELDLKFLDWSECENQIQENFGAAGFDEDSILEMISDYKIKYDKWTNNHDEILKWAAKWSDEKLKINRLLKTGDELKSAIQKIGIKTKLNENWEYAFLNAHFIRRRFTVADLLYFMGKLDDGLYVKVAGRVGVE
ncbi:iron-containing alcohol dehydrogenase [Patescibacteria group bacterium]